MNGDNVTYFESFRNEYIPKKTAKFIRNKDITTNIYRIQGTDLRMCVDTFLIICLIKNMEEC